jgi:hypothetical protein
MQRTNLGMPPLRKLDPDSSKKDNKPSDYVEREEGSYNKSIYVAVDLGKKADHTAITTIEPLIPKPRGVDSDIFSAIVSGGEKQFTYNVTKIKRYDLEIPYPKIARTLQKTDTQLNAKEDVDYIYYVIDEGGVGAAVTDQVCELIPLADVYRVTLTGGTRPRWNDSRNLSLPKPQMASTLIALLEADRIWIPRGEIQADIIRQELLNYEHKVSQVGYDQFGSMKTGMHDDIVSALGIGIYVAESMGGGSVPLMW